jgi:hypothetical protein
MPRNHNLPVAALLLIVPLPLAWLACGGGETKPPETAASEDKDSDKDKDKDKPAASESAAPAESASAAEAPAETASAAPAAASPPPAPSFGSSDCAKCVDKTCAKQEKACGKDSDCQSVLDSIHSCSSGAASCIDSATPPSAAKPKKLAGAYESCAKKAVASKTCKKKCE